MLQLVSRQLTCGELLRVRVCNGGLYVKLNIYQEYHLRRVSAGKPKVLPLRPVASQNMPFEVERTGQLMRRRLNR